MSFMRFLGGRASEAQPTQQTQPPLSSETEAVRRIVSRLEALPPEQARLLAGMAYVLARAAYADLAISDEETAAMEHELTESGLGLDESTLMSGAIALKSVAGIRSQRM